MKWVSRRVNFIFKKLISIIFIFCKNQSIFKVVGWETTASSVNLLTTHQKAFEWRKRAGGTTSQSSQNSLTPSFSYCARRISMSQRSMWFTMALCLSVVTIQLHIDNPDCLLISLFTSFDTNFKSLDGIEICSRWPQHILCHVERICSHCHVLLLHDRCIGTQISEIYLVEKIPYSFSNGECRQWNL